MVVHFADECDRNRLGKVSELPPKALTKNTHRLDACEWLLGVGMYDFQMRVERTFYCHGHHLVVGSLMKSVDGARIVFFVIIN